MKKCLIFLIIVLSIVFWYSYTSAYSSVFLTSSHTTAICGTDYYTEVSPPLWDKGIRFKIVDEQGNRYGTNGANTDTSAADFCSNNPIDASNPGYYAPNSSLIQTGVFTEYICLGSSYSDCNIESGDLLAVVYWTRSDGVIGEYIQNNTSRIDSISVSTSTNTVNLTGYWNATTTSGVYEQLEFYQINSIFGQEDYFTINATTSGAFNINFDYRNVATPYVGTTTIPITSNQIFYANLYEKNNAYYNPFGEYDFRYSTLLDATSTSLTASTTNTFNISTSTIIDYPEYECGLSSMTGCIKNALIWTFYPSQATIARYYALVELIQKKAPIGYFTITKNAINGLSATSTSAFSITIPAHLKSYIFNPIDFGLASIFWVYLIFSFYKRLKHLQI